jgi:hypothetical protein
MGSCEGNFLNRPPKDAVTSDEFFQTANDLKLATNNLYSVLPGKEVYTDDAKSDNIVGESVSGRVRGNRTTPTDKGSGGWSWSQLRHINYVIENYHRADDEEAKAKYSGIARFFRAYFYFKKVERFGDVPWYNKVLKPDDKDMYKARNSRESVIDSVLADLDYAIDNIPSEKKVFKITKYTALALKARVGLFAGTYRKYHDLGDYEKFLEAAVKASKTLMESGAYTLYTEGGEDKAYRDLFARNDQDDIETILAVKFTKNNRRHDLGYRMTAPTLGAWGLTKDLVNSYLMADGSRFTDQPDYKTMGFYEEMQNRDPRLTQTTAGPNFKVRGEDERAPVNLSITRTGYRVIKALPTRDQFGSGASINDVILFRYAETLLIYAEAKAELGSLTQNDLDRSINKLRDRVGMPHLNMVDANAHPDPYQESLYPNVDKGSNEGVILEIRRERRIELFNEGFRWNDLMRWKEGKKIEQPMVGLYFPDVGSYDFNNDGAPDVCVYDGDDSGCPDEIPQTARLNIQEIPLRNPNTGEVGGTSGNMMPHTPGQFEEPKDYLYPIPKQDLRLNKNLEQNPGWEE